MRITKILALLIITSGVIVSGIGLWQLWDVKNQEKLSLETARKLVNVDGTKKAKEMVTFQPKKGEVSGILVIPKISAELAIVEGTAPEDLEKGVGHYKGSYYPKEMVKLFFPAIVIPYSAELENWN